MELGHWYDGTKELPINAEVEQRSMDLLPTILHYPFYALVAIFVAVTFHEAGHFVVARWTGVHVVRFCVGFGKRLVSWRDRHGTEFAIAAIPLGGYVRLYDRRDADAAEHAPADPVLAERSYDRLKPQWRIAIALGGPAANFVLAFLLYWLVAVIGTTVATPIASVEADSDLHRAGMRSGEEITAVDGQAVETWAEIGTALVARLGDTGTIDIDTVDPARDGSSQRYAVSVVNWHAKSEDPDPLRSLGLGMLRPAVVGAVVAGEPGEQAGILAGDRIVRVNGEPVTQWGEFVAHVQASPETAMLVSVERDGGARTLRVTPRLEFDERGDEIGFLGLAPGGAPTYLARKNPLAAIGDALDKTWAFTALTVQLIGKMATLDVSPKNVAGPITIAKVSGDTARAGISPYLTLLAILSINLGIINLLPIPILDGGVVVFNAVELMRRKPLSGWTEAMTARVGIAIVAALMVLVFYVDIVRWLPSSW